jgi:hypothetical protein
MPCVYRSTFARKGTLVSECIRPSAKDAAFRELCNDSAPTVENDELKNQYVVNWKQLELSWSTLGF